MSADTLDAVLAEIRRQGRAAIAAQAAAEACLEEVHALRIERAADPVELARALLPLADALERMRAWAAAKKREQPPWWRRLVERDEHDRSMVDAVELLHAQLEAALAAIGVSADREVGVGVDGARHRVVEARSGGPPGTVVSVVRTGYALAGRCVREADVIATRAK